MLSFQKRTQVIFNQTLFDLKFNFLKTKTSDPSIVLRGTENVFFYCNQRPINYVKSELKEIVSNIRIRYKDSIGLSDDSNRKLPFIYVDIQIPPSEYDGTKSNSILFGGHKTNTRVL